MTAYYNENDPKAAAWLRELIKCGHIANGIVDERSIEDVTPVELAEFTQCHFFAGIGVWSYALRQAGWPDDLPVWTGSCPCQPFSAAGKGNGFTDERHLWPAFFHLIKHGKRNAAPVFGEQVASKDGLAWLDLVHSDLEGEGYAFGALDLCAAGFGAPHIRQRLYWVADPMPAGRPEGRTSARGGQIAGCSGIVELADTSEQRHDGRRTGKEIGRQEQPERSRNAGILANAEMQRHGAGDLGEQDRAEREIDYRGKDEGLRQPIACDTGEHCGMADTSDTGRQGRLSGWQDSGRPGQHRHLGRDGTVDGMANPQRIEEHEEQQRPATDERRGSADIPSRCSMASPRPSPTNGIWRNADWLLCRDGKWRPVEPGTFPLAHGAPARVGRLRGYGNAIVAETAKAFIEAYGSVLGE